MKKSSILTDLCFSEVGGCSGDLTPEDSERTFYYDTLHELFERAKNPEMDLESEFYTIANQYGEAECEYGFRQGIRFAVAFMSEAMASPLKSYNDFEKDFKNML
ncbi:MAG: hypothetical protein LBS36_05970 [Oscillospiraceae bacterium]|jgi:hypothetical protein|nr:hypothetical protein [Oscillospiraceae bacterium]